MLTELSKRSSRQQLQLFGHFTSEEIYELKKDGWWIVWREKPKVQKNKNGIPVGRAV